MNPLDFLSAIGGYVRNAPSDGSTGGPVEAPSTKRPIRLATIDPAYGAFASPPYPNGVPSARVTFEGESTLSGKYYPVATGLIPYPGQRVFMVPIGTTYLIAGAVSGTESQGFYGGASTGVEFGDGNYFDVVEGLSLDTDADIGGALTTGGPLDVASMRFVSNEKVLSGFPGSGSTASTAWVNLPGNSSMSFTKKYSGTYTKLMVTMKMSMRHTAGTIPATARIGVQIGGIDHDVDHEVMQTTGIHYPFFGIRELTGYAAGTYTIQCRIRNVSASTIAIDANDYLALEVREVSV